VDPSFVLDVRDYKDFRFRLALGLAKRLYTYPKEQYDVVARNIFEQAEAGEVNTTSLQENEALDI